MHDDAIGFQLSQWNGGTVSIELDDESATGRVNLVQSTGPVVWTFRFKGLGDPPRSLA